MKKCCSQNTSQLIKIYFSVAFLYNPLPYHEFLGLSKLKAFADDKVNVT